MPTNARRLQLVKLVHTVAWAFFAACIVAVPVATWYGRLSLATLLIGVVGVEVVVLLGNKWRCPLTDVAGRYTDDRRDNFDIYLPLWLARYNKLLFGSLYVAGIGYAIWRWRR
jgi:hypothetical protein